MMNKSPKLSLLAGALLLGLGTAAFAERPIDKQNPAANLPDPAQAVPAEPSTRMDPPPVDPTGDPNVQGDTVSDYARDQAQQQQQLPPPPDSPPGSTTSQVAHGQRDFMQLDADKDGMIAQAEVEADSELALEFETFDTNGDGELSRIEFDAYVLASVEVDDEEEEAE